MLFVHLPTITHSMFAGLSALDPRDPPTSVAKPREAIKITVKHTILQLRILKRNDHLESDYLC